MTSKGKSRQILVVAIANMASFCLGNMLGWTSPMQPYLESDESHLNRPLTRAELSWVGSINYIGAIIGTFFWGRVSDRIGRKRTAMAVAVPFTVGWLTVLLAKDVIVLYLGRILVGVGCSGTIINVPMFVTEIAQDDIRGILGSFLMLSLNLGCLFCYIVGAHASFTVLTSILAVIPIAYFVLLSWVPDSPVQLLAKNRFNKAEAALLWYRGGDKDQVERELISIQGRPQRKTPKYSTLIETRGRIKAFLLSFSFILGQQLSGNLAILTYSVTIFKEAGSSMTPYNSAILIGSLQCISSLTSTFLIDKCGRRILLVTSLSAMSLSLITLSGYFFYNPPRDSILTVVPVMSLSIHVIAFSLGIGPVPYIVIAEMFPPELRGLAISTIQTVGVSLSFASVKIFPFLVIFLGSKGCFLFYGTACAILSLTTMLFVPETKGRSLKSIIKWLEGEAFKDSNPEVN